MISTTQWDACIARQQAEIKQIEGEILNAKWIPHNPKLAELKRRRALLRNSQYVRSLIAR